MSEFIKIQVDFRTYYCRIIKDLTYFKPTCRFEETIFNISFVVQMSNKTYIRKNGFISKTVEIRYIQYANKIFTHGLFNKKTTLICTLYNSNYFLFSNHRARPPCIYLNLSQRAIRVETMRWLRFLKQFPKRNRFFTQKTLSFYI